MKMSDLEKIAGSGDSYVWRGVRGAFRGVGKGAVGAAKFVSSTTKYPRKAVGASAQGAAYVTAKGAENLSKRPLSTAIKAVALGTTVPLAHSKFSYDNYRKKVDNPVAFKHIKDFGRPSYLLDMQKTSEDTTLNTSPMTYLEKEAGLKEKVKNVAEWGGFALPKLLAGAGIVGIGSKVLGPTMDTTGQMLHRKLFSQENRLNMKDEGAKADMTAMQKYLAEQKVKSFSRANDMRIDMPKIESILSSLSKKDPILMLAVKNKKTHDIMKQTANALYSFSPSLAKNERAMQSILTEAVTSPEGGLSFQTIKSLAETQRFIDQNKR